MESYFFNQGGEICSYYVIGPLRGQRLFSKESNKNKRELN
jgi:hypothetical protein